MTDEITNTEDTIDSRDIVKRLKELESENVQLKKLVADQALDLAIMKEAVSGNF